MLVHMEFFFCDSHALPRKSERGGDGVGEGEAEVREREIRTGGGCLPDTPDAVRVKRASKSNHDVV